MAFRPRGRFHPDHLPEIAFEFFESASGIHFDRVNTRLFPTDEEAAALRALGLETGHYYGGPRTIIGRPPSEVAVDVGCAPGVQPLNPDIRRLFTGLHETAHFFEDIRNRPERLDFLRRIRAALATSGLEDARLGIDHHANIMTYYGESVGDIAAAIYMLNKYPDDPRMREYLTNWANYRSANAGVLGAQDRYHDTGDMLRRLLALPRDNPLFTQGNGITMEHATRLAVGHIRDNFGDFFRDFRAIAEMDRRWQAGAAVSDSEYALMYSVSPERMEELTRKRQSVTERRTQFCALTPPP